MDWCCITICLLFCKFQNSNLGLFVLIHVCVWVGRQRGFSCFVLFLFFFCNVKEGPYNELLFDSSLCEF